MSRKVTLGTTSFEAPRCPNHPDVVVKLLDDDDAAVQRIVDGKKLDGVCIYGCRVRVGFPSPFPAGTRRFFRDRG